tara:strand:- start:769 stop:942 length:174 start_codon:yes stop_codon:yes gene_type:complete
MLQVKLLWFALGQLSAMGQWMAAAEYAGDEAKRQRAMAHKALYFQAMDALLASLNRR